MKSVDAKHNSKEIIIRYVDSINRQDIPGLDDLTHKDYAFIGYDGEITEDRERMLNEGGEAEEGWKRYFNLYPEYKIHVSKVLVSGYDVAVIGKVTGSQLAPQREADTTFIWIAKIIDGLVTEWRIYREVLE